MGKGLLIVALLCVFSPVLAQEPGGLQDMYGITQIHGETHPKGITPADFQQSLAAALRHGQANFSYDFADAQRLAWFVHDHSLEEEALFPDFAERAKEADLSAPEAGRLMNEVFEAHGERVAESWAGLLDALSPETSAALERYVAEELIPTVGATRMDFEVFWGRNPDNYERLLGRLPPPPLPPQLQGGQTAVDPESGAVVYNVSVASSGASSAAVVSSSTSGSESEIQFGAVTLSAEQVRLQSFAMILERGLVDALVAEFGLDDSLGAREAHVMAVQPDYLDRHYPSREEFDRQRELNRERRHRQADAMQAVLDGASADEAYDRYGIAETGFDRALWERWVAHVSQRQIDQMRGGPEPEYKDPEEERAEKLAGDWVRFAALEAQLAPVLCPDGGTGEPDRRQAFRGDVAARCQPEARAWYEAWAADMVSEGPEGWTRSLLFFR